MIERCASVEDKTAIRIETQAVDRLKAGDLTGLEYLVHRYQVKAVHLAVLIVHDRELAEEIVQNSFFQAAQKIDQFDNHRPFAPWFLRIVVNAALQEASRQARAISLDDDEQASAMEAAGWLTAPETCPEDLVENEELYQAMWNALDQLSANQRVAMVMHYLQDSSEMELSQAFQRPRTTVKWWLYAARLRLRSILQREFFGEDNDQEVRHE